MDDADFKAYQNLMDRLLGLYHLSTDLRMCCDQAFPVIPTLHPRLQGNIGASDVIEPPNKILKKMEEVPVLKKTSTIESAVT